jgi:two-component system response regulator MprA
VPSRDRVLLVDDDLRVLEAIERALAIKGFVVSTADCGERALEQIALHVYDVIVLDIQMPDIDGIAVCQRLRGDGDLTPVLMLTARDGVQDRVLGLHVGADDYLVKPFALDELIARIRALLRRAEQEGRARVLRIADLVLDPTSVSVRRGDREIELTLMEFRLLELLMRNPRRVITRDLVVDQVWGGELDLASNSLTVHISTLRRKLEATGASRLIHTVRGVGYVLREP